MERRPQCLALVAFAATLVVNCSHPAKHASLPRPAHAMPAPRDGEHRDGEHRDGKHRGPSHAHAHAEGAPGYAMDFSETSRFAAHFDDPERDAWQKPAEVLALLELRSGHFIADLGAGTGYFEPHLSRAVGSDGRVWALDAEPAMVQHLRERTNQAGFRNVEPRLVPSDDPELPSASVDRVLIVNTWHHIGHRERYARKLTAALRPRGFVLVVDFTPESDLGPPPDHRLAAERVAAELNAGGLRARVLTESLPKQYVVRGDHGVP